MVPRATDGEGDLKVPVRLLEQVELNTLASAEAAHGIGLIRQTHLLKVTVEVVTGLAPGVRWVVFLEKEALIRNLRWHCSGTVTHLLISVGVDRDDVTSRCHVVERVENQRKRRGVDHSGLWRPVSHIAHCMDIGQGSMDLRKFAP